MVDMKGGMFTSLTGEWETPQELFDLLDQEFHFEWDVCASHNNHKCKKYITKGDNSFACKWDGICWMNPPYGREIGKWIKRAYESGLNGSIVVCLIPSRTDTRWWHDYVMKSSDIRFIKGRLKFGGSTNSAPFPSAIVVFSKSTIRTKEVSQ